MSQKILIDGSNETQTQFALLSDNELEDFEFESISRKNLKGNIYLGKVSRIEASLQAAFVDIGSEKNGFLAFGEKSTIQKTLTTQRVFRMTMTPLEAKLLK